MSEGGRVLAALVGATVMVGAAIGVRNLREGDDGGGGGDGDEITLACPEELAEVCRQADLGVDVVTERAATTAEQLMTVEDAEDEVEPDIWLVPRPWIEAVDAVRAGGRLGPLLEEQVTLETVARTPVVLVMWEERAAALEAGGCGGRLDWRCLGDAAEAGWDAAGGQSSWGRVKVGLADPASASGSVVLGAATGGFLETTDYATNDLSGDLLRWLDRFAASAGEAGRADAVQSMLTQGGGYLSALATTEAAATAAAERDDVRVQVLDPAATVDLVVVPLRDECVDEAQDIATDDGLRDALAAAGWRVEGRDLAAGLDPDLELPADAGVPSGAVLNALFTEWQALL